ncbi:protein angel isoform X2 [Copidosoma floridanum]|uniref:protein angel isoform X2 n=1 Tax=Copidosoma floridanum TaxID=29053 RepID=UPI0006C967CB|nr:protein angel isoform X2 [Copidosoma floridanum]
MSRTTRFLAPASQAISAYYPKVYLQTIPHRHFNISTSASSLLVSKPSMESSQKPSFMDKLECSKVVNETLEFNNEHLHNALQKMKITDNMDENVNCIDGNHNDGSRNSMTRKRSLDKSKYKGIRGWKRIEETTCNSEESFTLKLLSYNILAQDLLETHYHLYKYHNEEDLPWETRKPLILKEIMESKADIICLQEVQEKHLKDFLVPFQESGFTHLYKKRTGGKTDGLLLLYKKDLFNLLEFSKVELYQFGIELLSRDNVALIAKFSVKNDPEMKFVVATTHLLYNPRRNDVRLGQVQLLFAEIERISFIRNTELGPQYLPIVLSGDFNLVPNSGVYKFITEGSIEFKGKGPNLEKCDYRCLTNSLIPPHLYVTDECQHLNILARRLSGKGSGKVMLTNVENKDFADFNSLHPEEKNLVDFNKTTYQKVEVATGHYATFSSGLLTHPFQFKSVYQHFGKDGLQEATTYQDEWITVDYIFYSSMKPIEKYTLPVANECSDVLRTIPNSFVGSDHLCIGATFQINKR